MFHKVLMARENLSNDNCELTSNELDSVSGGSGVQKFSTIPNRSKVDGNGQYDALTDGLLIMRYLH